MSHGAWQLPHTSSLASPAVHRVKTWPEITQDELSRCHKHACVHASFYNLRRHPLPRTRRSYELRLSASLAYQIRARLNLL
ncbi:hypothetical protein K504DRAFT_260919 [Pleomassaria siparia CBS 279.74]|uniref:Uncharacterized protein n=1 Tax=Pleomassaria siparia CBS 279.74 TaxID=1314801 RepID=A0A6G1KBX4_9PLEO|nr:hypothetical protein K504DRAFT_260919 [Pleomassaria siparia CBS 279.74]